MMPGPRGCREPAGASPHAGGSPAARSRRTGRTVGQTARSGRIRDPGRSFGRRRRGRPDSLDARAGRPKQGRTRRRPAPRPGIDPAGPGSDAGTGILAGRSCEGRPGLTARYGSGVALDSGGGEHARGKAPCRPPRHRQSRRRTRLRDRLRSGNAPADLPQCRPRPAHPDRSARTTSRRSGPLYEEDEVSRLRDRPKTRPAIRPTLRSAGCDPNRSRCGTRSQFRRGDKSGSTLGSAVRCELPIVPEIQAERSGRAPGPIRRPARSRALAPGGDAPDRKMGVLFRRLRPGSGGNRRARPKRTGRSYRGSRRAPRPAGTRQAREDRNCRGEQATRAAPRWKRLAGRPEQLSTADRRTNILCGLAIAAALGAVAWYFAGPGTTPPTQTVDGRKQDGVLLRRKAAAKCRCGDSRQQTPRRPGPEAPDLPATEKSRAGGGERRRQPRIPDNPENRRPGGRLGPRR